MSVYHESTVKRTTGSENLATALIEHIVVCAPLGPLAVVGHSPMETRSGIDGL